MGELYREGSANRRARVDTLRISIPVITDQFGVPGGTRSWAGASHAVMGRIGTQFAWEREERR